MVGTTAHAANICVATVFSTSLGGKQEMKELQSLERLEQQTWQQLLKTQLISLSG